MGTEKDISIKVKSALVTGGGGFVGKAIVKMLLAQGVQCRVIGRNRYPELESKNVECIAGSITDRKKVEQATKDIDLVFHVAALAGIWGPWQEFYQTNVVGTQVVVDSCIKNKVAHLVHTSTPSVVFNRRDISGEGEDLPYATNFLCNYAKSKVMAEKIILFANSSELKTCSLRPHLIWGPGDPHLLPRLVTSGRKKLLKKVGDGCNLVDITYIDNVAYAHILAAKNLCEEATAAGKPFFISQDEPVNLWGWINELFSMLGIEPVNKSVSFSAASRAGYFLEIAYQTLKLRGEPRMTRFLAEQLAKSHYFSVSAAKSVLGYTPLVTTEQGLAKTIDWLKTERI